MADDDERPPLTAETLDRIRARLLARANFGVDPTSPLWLDATVGSIYGDLEIPAGLELDEFYDFAELVVRATIPIDSYGEWLDDWAESLGLERKDVAFASGVLHFAGAPGAVIPVDARFTTSAPIDEDPIAFRILTGGEIPGAGTIDLDVLAVIAGSAGNVPASTVTLPAAAIDGLTSLTNLDPMTGGADVESDELLLGRVRDDLGGIYGPGTQDDYRKWLTARPGIGFATVNVAARGAGTLDVYILDVDHNPMAPAAVAETQVWLDPVPRGHGLGQAPIGHDALVLTPTALAVVYAADVTYAPGYSLDGAGGTRALGPSIEAALALYTNALVVGGDVINAEAVRAIMDVKPGVVNVTAVTINAGAAGADLAVAADRVAFYNGATLT